MQNNATGTQAGNHSQLAAVSPIRRSVVLQAAEIAPAALRSTVQNTRRKKVWLDPPWPVVCAYDGGTVRIDGLLLGIWDHGARLRVNDASPLTEFDLLLASGPRPVTRRCKRLSVWGCVIDVEFKPRAPQ